jgi:uncharacterized protein YndB with AHSA1/START domain
MPQHEVRFTASLHAPRERVFAFFADHEQFVRLFGAHGQRIRAGDSEPDGLGSVRRVGPGPLSFDETIVTFERPARIEYRITRGGPLKNHLGTIDFSAEGDTTRIDYVIRFDVRIPGTGGLIAALLRRAWKTHAPQRLAEIR